MRKPKTEGQDVVFLSSGKVPVAVNRRPVCVRRVLPRTLDPGVHSSFLKTTATWILFKGNYDNHSKGYKESLKAGTSGSVLSIWRK